MVQEKNAFDSVTIKKILIGALIAGGGAVLTYVAQLELNFGVYTPIATAVLAILINMIKEYKQGE